jgi:LacI family transcriptional regulator
LQKRVDGIIATGSIGDAQRLSSVSAAVIVIGRHDLPHPAVRVDNVAAAREAARHLIDRGHRRIGVVSFGPDATSGIDRLSGLRAELRQHGLRLDKGLIAAGNFSEESGYRAAMTLLSRNDPPTAVLAMNDRMAIGAMAAAADLGIRIPRDLAVVGFDDIPAASYMRPSLSSVAHPAHAMGVAAMIAMFDLLAGKPVPPTTWIPTALVVRESSGPARPKRRTQ